MPMLDYLFIDVIMVMSLSAAITRAPPLETLGRNRPTGSLLGPTTVASVLGPTAFNMICLRLCMRLVAAHPEYVRFPAAYSQGAAWWTLGARLKHTPDLISSSIFLSVGECVYVCA